MANVKHMYRVELYHYNTIKTYIVNAHTIYIETDLIYF